MAAKPSASNEMLGGAPELRKKKRPEGRFSVGGELRHSLPSLPLLMMQLLWLTGL